MHKYERIVYWSPADNAFIAEVPELPGCMVDGATAAGAMENAEQVISEWLEIARERGQKVPEPRENLM